MGNLIHPSSRLFRLDRLFQKMVSYREKLLLQMLAKYGRERGLGKSEIRTLLTGLGSHHGNYVAGRGRHPPYLFRRSASQTPQSCLMKIPTDDDSFDEDISYSWISGECLEGYCYDLTTETFELSSYCQ